METTTERRTVSITLELLVSGPDPELVANVIAYAEQLDNVLQAWES